MRPWPYTAFWAFLLWHPLTHPKLPLATSSRLLQPHTIPRRDPPPPVTHHVTHTRYPKSQGQPQGRVRTLAGGAGKGYVNGNATAARFNEPTGVAVDAARNVCVPPLPLPPHPATSAPTCLVCFVASWWRPGSAPTLRCTRGSTLFQLPVCTHDAVHEV